VIYLEVLHEEERMSANPHSATMRDDLISAIIERLRARASPGNLADEIERLIQALRDCEKEEWEPEFGGEDRLRDLMGERIAAFRMREPSMKPIDPLWRGRAIAFLMAETAFRAESYDLEILDGVASPNRSHWEPIIKELWTKRPFKQPDNPTDALITETLKARTFRGMALRLAYHAWGNPAQDIEDFREKLERIVARLGPHSD
jgi:hypothetical protein